MLDDSYIAFVQTIGTKDGKYTPAPIAALGLAGEAAELVEAVREYLTEDGTRDAALKELGDCVWYVVALAGFDAWEIVDRHRVGYHLGLRSLNKAADAYQQLVGRICDLEKKKSWHDKDVHPASDLQYALSLLEQIAGHLDTNLDQIAALNVEKLRARWPSGFGVAK